MIVLKEIGLIILKDILYLSPLFLIGFAWKRRQWIRKKWLLQFGNKKHLIVAHFLNVEGCISSVINTVINQGYFVFGGEQYQIDKDAIWHESHGSAIRKNERHTKRVNDMLQESIEKLNNITEKIRITELNLKNNNKKEVIKIQKKINKTKNNEKRNNLRIKKERLIKDFNILLSKSKVLTLYKNTQRKLITKIKNLENEIETINYLDEGSGMPHILYIDGNPLPIKRKDIQKMYKKEEIKWDAEIIYKKQNEKYWSDLLTPENTKMGLILILLVMSLVVNVITLIMLNIDKFKPTT